MHQAIILVKFTNISKFGVVIIISMLLIYLFLISVVISQIHWTGWVFITMCVRVNRPHPSVIISSIQHTDVASNTQRERERVPNKESILCPQSHTHTMWHLMCPCHAPSVSVLLSLLVVFVLTLLCLPSASVFAQCPPAFSSGVCVCVCWNKVVEIYKILLRLSLGFGPHRQTWTTVVLFQALVTFWGLWCTIAKHHTHAYLCCRWKKVDVKHKPPSLWNLWNTNK